MYFILLAGSQQGNGLARLFSRPAPHINTYSSFALFYPRSCSQIDPP